MSRQLNESVTTCDADTIKPDTITISVRGKWIEVPALGVNGQTLIIQGKTIRMASLHDEDWLEHEADCPHVYVARLKEQPGRLRADIFTFSQRVPSTEPQYSFPMERRSVAVADVSTFGVWWERLPQVTRKNVRRSQKRGVTLRLQHFDADLVRGIAEVQNESPIRQGRRYPHYGKSHEEVMRDHGAFLDRSDFICAYSGDEFIGFLKLVYRGNLASILQINSKMAHYDKRPSNALMAKAIELCEGKHVSYLTYGNFDYGHGQSSLQEFKERNGFYEMLIPTYYVPLTPWGGMCVKLGLYQSPKHFLPARALSVGRALRARWYNRRLVDRPV